MVRNQPANTGNTGLIPGSEKSPGEGNDKCGAAKLFDVF